MLGLYRKFSFNAASIKRPKTITVSDCQLYPNARRELICKTPQTDFVVVEDVYSYYAEGTTIWYSTTEDLAAGKDVVYQLDVNDLHDRRKGIIDDKGRFLFVENGGVYCGHNGDTSQLCQLDSVDSLFRLTGQRAGVNLKDLEDAFGCDCGLQTYTDTEFYRDLNQLHTLVGLLEEERKKEIYTSAVSAQIIAKVIQMCCEMNKNVSWPLQKIMEKELA